LAAILAIYIDVIIAIGEMLVHVLNCKKYDKTGGNKNGME
jgi:hypothetical protein